MLIVGASLLVIIPANHVALPAVTVAPRPRPAFAGDAPDPDVVRAGSTYYAFTTGTVLGNNLQALVDTSGTPMHGWRSYTGTSYGSSALPNPPSWEEENTQTSPGVFLRHRRWIMFYDASVAPHPIDSGFSCLSVATAPTLSPSHPVFTDTSRGPLYCQPGGVLDPSPFLDRANGSAYLLWKSNDGSSNEPSQVWGVRLRASGIRFAGRPRVLLTVDQAQLPWETTLDDPQLVTATGRDLLLFSPGNWQSSTYGEALTTCRGPLGPCRQPSSGPFLTSYGTVTGPGGGSLFQDAHKHWFLAFAAWKGHCTSYSYGGRRRLFVAPINLRSKEGT